MHQRALRHYFHLQVRYVLFSFSGNILRPLFLRAALFTAHSQPFPCINSFRRMFILQTHFLHINYTFVGLPPAHNHFPSSTFVSSDPHFTSCPLSSISLAPSCTNTHSTHRIAFRFITLQPCGEGIGISSCQNALCFHLCVPTYRVRILTAPSLIRRLHLFNF